MMISIFEKKLEKAQTVFNEKKNGSQIDRQFAQAGVNYHKRNLEAAKRASAARLNGDFK